MLKLVIENGTLFVGNRKVCSAGAGNGRTSLRAGKGAVKTDFSDEHDTVLIRADGLGWVGPAPECDIVLGQVRHRNGVIPCATVFHHVFTLVEHAEEVGEPVSLEVVA